MFHVEHPLEPDFIFIALGIAAFCAGFVDAIVGGGGLIQIPALLSAYPALAPASLFGTNKVASIVGTSSAAVQYSRKVVIPWRIALPGAIAALIFAWFGAMAVAFISPSILRPLILILLILVAIYTFIRKDFGAVSNECVNQRQATVIAIVIGCVIGFYDGFFGPGTGSFLIILFIRFLGMDFLKASATAKIVNVSTNLGAIAYFSSNITLLWQTAALMAVCNFLGSVIGARTAVKKGSAFIRKIFLCIVVLLITKLAYDTFFR